MANRLTVSIGGQTFHLVADESVEYMSQIAHAADEKVTEACRLAGGNTFAAGVLAVLNIADDAVKSAAELEKLRARCAALEQKAPSDPAQTDALHARYDALEQAMLAAQEKLDALTAETESLRAENERLSAENAQLRQRRRRKK